MSTRRYLLLAISFMLIGCASPTPVAMSHDSISIKYDIMLNSQDEVLQQAQDYCATMNKKAVLKAQTEEGIGLGFHYNHYDCVKG